MCENEGVRWIVAGRTERNGKRSHRHHLSENENFEKGRDEVHVVLGPVAKGKPERGTAPAVLHDLHIESRPSREMTGALASRTQPAHGSIARE